MVETLEDLIFIKRKIKEEIASLQRILKDSQTKIKVDENWDILVRSGEIEEKIRLLIKNLKEVEKEYLIAYEKGYEKFSRRKR